MQVFFVSHFGDPPQFGTSSLERIDGDYVRVDGDLFAAAFVWPATDENLAIYNQYVLDLVEWRALEPNMYSVLNKMTR